MVAEPVARLAITGPGMRVIEGWCAQAGCAIAIRIAADAAVAGGPPAALQALQRLALDAGAKCSPLNVAVASHTPAMQPAAQAFAQVLRTTALRPPRTALFCNATAERVHTAAQAADVLAAQIAQTVQWSDCLDALHARQLSCVLEIGPGSALAAMWNRRHPDVPARSADEFRSARAVVDWVRGKLD